MDEQACDMTDESEHTLERLLVSISSSHTMTGRQTNIQVVLLFPLASLIIRLNLNSHFKAVVGRIPFQL